MRLILNGVLIALIVTCSSLAYAFGSDDQWTSGYGQGVAEAIITKGPGNRIYVTCSENAGQTGINFMLGGKAPEGSTIELTFDGENPQQYSIWDGSVPSQCHACASVYESMISGFRKHKSVYVRFENGDATRFTLQGANDAITQCIPEFAR